MIRVTDAIILDDSEVTERFIRASGPGGQNLKKEATAVELRLDLRASSLPSDVKKRLIALAGRDVTTDGVLIVGSRARRLQTQNRDAARTRLVALLKRAATPPKKRRPTKPRAAAREERLASKRLEGAVKRSRTRQRDDQSA